MKKNIINHSLREIAELGLLVGSEWRTLKWHKLNSLEEILGYYREHHHFDSLIDGRAEIGLGLVNFCNGYITKEHEPLSSNKIFSKEFVDLNTLIIPVKIAWENLTEVKRRFLDIWIKYSIDYYTDKNLKSFITAYIGDPIDAETFYDAAILHPVPNTGRSTRDSSAVVQLDYLRKGFTRFYEATTVLDEPLELFKFFCFWEYFVDYNHPQYQKITALNKESGFPYAYTVYETLMASKYFNRRRRMQDLNMMRFVSIFQDDPYTYGGLNYMLSEPQFIKLQKQANDYANYGCRFIIATLKALGLRDNYKLSPEWNGQLLTNSFVETINRTEGRHLPISFYALLFNALYGTRFQSIDDNDGMVGVGGYFNVGG